MPLGHLSQLLLVGLNTVSVGQSEQAGPNVPLINNGASEGHSQALDAVSYTHLDVYKRQAILS